MNSQDIPGYYYDPSSDSYFKIQSNNAASFLSASSISGESSQRESQRRLEEVLTKSGVAFKANRPILDFFERYELLGNTHIQSRPSAYALAQFKHMRHQQRCPMDTPVAKSVLLDTNCGTKFHVIDLQHPAIGLRQYRLNWKQPQFNENGRRIKRFRRPRFKINSCPQRYEGPNCYGASDATWHLPGKRIACLSSNSLSFLKVSGTGYELDNSLPLPRLCNPQFAQSMIFPTRFPSPQFPLSDIPAPQAPMFFSSRRIFCYTRDLRLLMQNTSTRSSFGAPKILASNSSSGGEAGFTAVAQADAIYSSSVGPIPFYVAMGNRFSLVTSYASYRNYELVSFDVGSHSGEITHLQALFSPSGDRMGVIVGRRNGQVEFWDDRFSKKPAVSYYGSDAGCSNYTDVSPVPPRPVVDSPFQMVLASPLVGCAKIGVWELQTGHLINMMDYPVGRGDNPKSAPPPMLMMRSLWGKPVESRFERGPMVMAVGTRYADFFYL